jgi:hypothetical protein
MIISLGVMKAVSALDKVLSKPGVDYASKRAASGRYNSTGTRYVSSGQRMGNAPGAAGHNDGGNSSAKVTTPVVAKPDSNYSHLEGGVKGGSSSGNTGARGTPLGSMGSARMANGLPDTSTNNKAGRMASWSQAASRQGTGRMSGIG